MNAMKKLKSKRGMTLAEVLTVVAIMAILLGVAMPNLLSESQKIKLTAMDGNARSVAVAVQSRLYGMKNAGTGLGSEYYSLNNLAASDIEITEDSKTKNEYAASGIDVDGAIKENGETKKVKYVSNFANGTNEDAKDRAKLAKQLLFSGAITDTELLQNGKIVVVYDPATAYVIWTFYSEDEFNIDNLLKEFAKDDNETYRKSNMIGVYQGEYAPEPERKVRVPEFSCRFVFDDELYLEMALAEEPSDELEGKRLGIEVYAEIPKINGEGAVKEETKAIDEIGIYYQGIFASDYTTKHANTIKQDSEENTKLTIDDIKNNGGFLRFALDSMVTNKAGFDNTKEYLRHQNHPEYVSVAEPLLYPRESLDNWFNPTVNPYLTVWYRENAGHIPEPLKTKIFKGSNVTEYVGVDETMRLRVRIFVLSDTTHGAAKGAQGEENNAQLYTEDENFAPFETESEAVSPYFNALTKNKDEGRVTLSALRDLNNLKYVFTTDNSVNEADLNRDISGQQFYEKLVAVRYALLAKKSGVGDWELSSNRENVICDTLSPNKPFTLSGKNSKGGNYAIVGISGGGRAETLGGLFGYAENLTVKDLDIVNPVTWRDGFSSSFLTMDEKNENITEINASYGSSISGSLVGIAVNCTFDNVHSYIDPSRVLKMEVDENTLDNHTTRYPYAFGYNRTSGVVAGGLVGLAITSQDTKPVKAKSSETKTTFKDCSASLIVCSEINSYTSKCIYAGGLIGMTMGGVEITDCYAASQLSGYYSGGLVGCVVKAGNWTYNKDNNSANKKEGKGNGELKIENSFASGIIQRQTRIGAGLIAQICGNTTSQVSNCYSSVKWEILPPVAYGTFKGDDKNYYISQTYIVVPITVNVEAHFKCTGDVFSLNEDTKSGIPCANEKDLKENLKNGLTNAGEKELKTKLTAPEWTTATNTCFWQWESNILTSENKEDSENPDSGYPFPMRTGNTKFSGSWIGEMQVNLRGYGENTERTIVTVYDEKAEKVEDTFESECEGFYCAFYWAGGYHYPNSKDNGTITSMKFNRWNGNLFMGSVTLDAKQLATDWWRTDGENEYGQGDEGVIKVTYEDSTKEFTFTGFDYNSPVFDPFKQDKFKLETTDGVPENMDEIINDPQTTLNWDYYGFYFGNTDKNFKHYIKFNKEEGQIEQSGDYILVNKDDFTKHFSNDKQHSYTVTLKQVLETGYQEDITCDENGCFCAEECKDKGEAEG